MNKTIKLAMVAALSLMAISNVACSRKKAQAAADKSVPFKPEAELAYVKTDAQNAELMEIFGQIDPSYDYSNQTLASKIDDVTLEYPAFQKAPFSQEMGFVRGTIKIKGFDEPVGYYSKAVKKEDLQQGVKLETHGAPSKWDDVVGGQATGMAKCLDVNCEKVAVYFRMYQGAGYIFQLQPVVTN